MTEDQIDFSRTSDRKLYLVGESGYFRYHLGTLESARDAGVSAYFIQAPGYLVLLHRPNAEKVVSEWVADVPRGREATLGTRIQPTKAEDHALMGMAQTRASSRALRGPLQQIVELAGYKGTPAEEMVEEAKAPDPKSAPTKQQVARIRDLIATLAEERPDVDWREFAQDAAGVPGTMLTSTLADVVIDTLEAERESEAA